MSFWNLNCIKPGLAGRRSFCGLARVVASLVLIAGMDCYAASAAKAGAPTVIDFNREIRPILSENCFACHGPDETKRKAGLSLTSREAAMKPAKSGAVAVVPGDVAKSELIKRVTTTDEDEHMPPAKTGKKLTPAQVELLKRWVAQGAPWKQHWAYVKPERPALSSIQNKKWPRNEIDHFVLARLEKERLHPSPEAARETLIRRLSLDLIGLPPTTEEVSAFVHDQRPGAYQLLVERLLDSPHYGERWARPWLDQARYADSNGYEADNRRTIWPYRDWVINAFNRDLPFDQFTIEQLAGDLLPNATREQKIASGFHRNTMVNTEGGTDEEEFRVAALVDRVNTTYAIWMGTTMGCAQCHTHKYDPFTQKEYYQSFAFLNQTKDKGRSNEPEMPLPSPEQKKKSDELKAQIEPLQKILDTQTPELDDALAKWAAELREQWKKISASWTTLEPQDLKATEGVTLEKLADNLVFSSGPTPDNSNYEVAANTATKAITAVRVEALIDDRLPQKSSGRSEDGDFVLTDFSVEATAANAPKVAAVELPEMSAWQMVGPFPAASKIEAFEKDFIATKDIDLKHTYADGKLRWTKKTEFTDGEVHSLSGEVSATYLYRTISTKEATILDVGLGSDDGLQVWLNGEKILSRDVERGVAPNQDTLKLALLKGENRLLLKISNGGGDSGFYFGLANDARVPFETAYADFSMERYGVKDAIDDKPKSGWAIAAHEATNRVDHHAVFVAKKSFGFNDGTNLRFRLKQESDRAQHLLGKFRLSVSIAPADVHRVWGKVPDRIRGLLVMTPDKLTDEQKKDLAKHYRSIAPTLDMTREQVAELEKQKPKDIPTTLVMEEVEKPRDTKILIRGSHLNPGDVVEAATPSVLHAWPAGEPTNRLGFARWVVSPENPLVGRVTMNRIWAQYFGRGLVETSEEFGAQGEPPTHPELLDWLATELVRQGWSLKAMHRLIVNSATYRQSSIVPPALAQSDPFNRLLARGPRFRLEAEMVRDNALAVSGLLNRKIGGPSVFPAQPDGVWNSPYNNERWPTSKDGDQFRRGLYTFWKRTAPYASFMAFDAPSREVVCERRARSNTPVQALVTLNDPAFLAPAAALARRIVTDGGRTEKTRLEYAFRRCVARSPNAQEAEPLLKLYRENLKKFANDTKAAKAMATPGLPEPDAKANLPELAAWTVIANVLLNLDETLTKG
ncbi:MAG: PSD1 domain-containing protein [Verrucomicrobia bacterium]|nr:PSD1 domain-containing protein [Verrucomicrobiota bacterium]